MFKFLLFYLLSKDRGFSNFLAGIFYFFLILLIFGFILKNFILIILISLVLIVIITGIKVFKYYIKYKDETPEEREKRLKIEEMIKKWRNERK